MSSAFAALIFCCAGCFGNQDDGALQAQLKSDPAGSGVVAEGTSTLGGFIVSDANNRFNAPSRALAAVSGVTVTLLETGLLTYTDRFGYYEFPGIAPGVYTIFARRNDGEGAVYVNYVSATARVNEKVLVPQSIVLKRSSSLFGRVAASDGATAAGFLVSLDNYPVAAVSSDGGFFRLDAVPAEQPVYLSVSRAGYCAKKVGPVTALEGRVCSLIDVITVDADQAAAGTITGTVADSAAGSPLAGVLIKLYEPQGASRTLYKTEFSDGSGAFSIGAAAGKTYTAEFVRQDYFNASATVSVAAGASSSLKVKMVRARSGLSHYSISGVVRDGSGAPVAGATVSSSPFTEQILTAADGSYKINIPEGVFDLYASKTGYATSSSRITARPYVIVPAAVDFVIVKSSATQLYTLSGTVSGADNQPLAGAKVSIDKNNLYAYTNQAGYYSLYVTGGTYEVSATAGAGLGKTFEFFMRSAPQTLDIKLIKTGGAAAPRRLEK